MKNTNLTLFITTIAIVTSFLSFGQNYKFGKVSEEEVLQKEHPIEKNANAAVLYRDISTKFDYDTTDGFFTLTDVHERVKIYNKEGFDWATRTVKLYQGSGSTDEKLLNLKGYSYAMANGKMTEDKLRNDGIFEVDLSKFAKQVKFTMPNIKEGTVIEYKYTIRSPFVSNIDVYKFQEKIPVDKVNFRFASPEYLNYKSHQKGWIPFNIVKGSKNRSVSITISGGVQAGTDRNGGRQKSSVQNINFVENSYAVQIDNVPPLLEEAFSGNIDNYAASLKFELEYTQYPGSTYKNYATTWEAVSKTIYESQSFGEEINMSNYFSSDIDALVAGTSNPDEKMLKIFEFVKQKVTWNKYLGVYTNEGVKDAYKKGTGNSADINLMLVAMLQHAGLQANPVLLSTKSNGIPIFPTRSGFNYVVAGVEKDNTVVLLDATNKLGEPNILEPELLNWQGRIIRKNGSSAFVSLYPNAIANESALITIDINEDLSANGVYKSRCTGHYALKYRDNYRNLAEDDTRKRLEKNKTETEISNIQFENLDKLYQPVKLSYDFTSLDAVEKIGDKLYVSPMIYMAVKENPFKLDKRDYPIDFTHSFKDRYLITVNLPQGYEVETMPEGSSFGLPNNAGIFRYVATNSGDKVQLSVEFAMNQAVLPADYYAGLKEFFQLLIDKENEKIVLKKV